MRRITLTALALIFSLNFSFGQKVEAESGTLKGLNKSTSRAGYSGTGYVTGFDAEGDELTLQMAVGSEGVYSLWVGYAASDRKVNKVLVNGETKDVEFPASTGFTERLMGKVRLREGANTIKIVHYWGYFDVDYIRVAKTTATEIDNFSSSLSNPNASGEAKILYRYLSNAYGKRILSGQQNSNDESEFEYILQKTGKQPAVRGFDFIDHSPSRVENGTSPSETPKIIAWHDKGGIVTSAWHWNAPKDLHDTSEQPWWRGFYTVATSFDVSIAMNDEDSEEYELIIRDMDVIAEELKELRDKNIPILWRPLHEAEGRWFWWGAKGPEPLKWLWQLMYDRYTNHHQLNNLIWVWTSQEGSESAEWYPGDEYVDIVGADIYLNKQDYSANFTYFDNLVTLFEGEKIVTMSETGIIPDPDRILNQRAKWSWFCVWAGDFIKDLSYNSLAHINKVYNHEYVITLDELPDFSNYEDPGYSDLFEPDEPVIPVTGLNEAKTNYAFHPNPVTDRLVFTSDRPSVISSIDVIDSMGREVLRLRDLKISSQMEIDFSDFKAGIYVVKLNSDGEIRTFKIIKK